MIQVPTTVAVDVRRALDEDIRTGDVTVDLIPADADGQRITDDTRSYGDRWNLMRRRSSDNSTPGLVSIG